MTDVTRPIGLFVYIWLFVYAIGVCQLTDI